MELKLLCWNVNGIRSVKNKGFIEWMKKEQPDMLCLQETKVDSEKVDEDLKRAGGYYSYWNTPKRKGYAGVATYSNNEPLRVTYDLAKAKLELEGRVIVTEHPWFALINCHFPNGKQGPERLKYKMDFYDVFLKYVVARRKKGDKLIICGDVNTAHTEIDLARPVPNSKVSGFLPEERAWVDKFISKGFIDTFRHFHKEPDQYSWWDYKTGARARNVGWRIDYFFISEDLLPKLTDAFIMKEVMGSDHCPVGIKLRVD